MKCLQCQGRMQRATAPFQIDRPGVHISIECVPAWVCAQCGEPFFEEREVAEIQDLIQAVDDRARRFAIPA